MNITTSKAGIKIEINWKQFGKDKRAIDCAIEGLESIGLVHNVDFVADQITLSCSCIRITANNTPFKKGMFFDVIPENKDGKVFLLED